MGREYDTELVASFGNLSKSLQRKEKRDEFAVCLRRMQAKHHSDPAHSWPRLCHIILRILLTVLPSLVPMAVSPRQGAKHLCGGKLATS